MVMKKVDCSTENIEDALSKLKEDSPNHSCNLILFLADVDPSTSLSWCPDCVTAEPVIYQTLEEAHQDVALLRVYVGDKPTWRNPLHPLRVHPTFLLTGVPTLLRWDCTDDGDSVSARLEDDQAHFPDKIASLLSPPTPTPTS